MLPEGEQVGGTSLDLDADAGSGVVDPAGETELSSQAVDERAKADPLDVAANDKSDGLSGLTLKDGHEKLLLRGIVFVTAAYLPMPRAKLC
jgi:hypothetical protein